MTDRCGGIRTSSQVPPLCHPPNSLVAGAGRSRDQCGTSGNFGCDGSPGTSRRTSYDARPPQPVGCRVSPGMVEPDRAPAAEQVAELRSALRHEPIPP